MISSYIIFFDWDCIIGVMTLQEHSVAHHLGGVALDVFGGGFLSFSSLFLFISLCSPARLQPA